MNGIRRETPGTLEAELKIAFINRYCKNELSEVYLKNTADEPELNIRISALHLGGIGHVDHRVNFQVS
jgi:hypothetical protein